MNKLVKIERELGRVFTAQDLAVAWEYPDESKLFELIKYYVRRGQLVRLARGLYAKQDYSEEDLRADAGLLLEVANKLVPNSYVSLFTVLRTHGVVWQYYGEVYSVAESGRKRKVRGVEFVYRQAKLEILLSDDGLEKSGQVRLAGLERAILDTLYFYPEVNLDNLSKVKWGSLIKIARIYNNKALLKRVKEMGRQDA